MGKRGDVDVALQIFSRYAPDNIQHVNFLDIEGFNAREDKLARIL